MIPYQLPTNGVGSYDSTPKFLKQAKEKCNVMYIYEGRFCKIEELTTQNNFDLYQLMHKNRAEYERLIYNEPVSRSYPEFVQKIDEWFSHGRNYQFLVYSKKSADIVGTMFFYEFGKLEKTVKCSCFFVPKTRSTVLIIESLSFLLGFAKHVLKAESVRFSVYRENILMLDVAKKTEALLLNTRKVNTNTIIDYEFSAKRIDSLLEKYGYLFSKLIT